MELVKEIDYDFDFKKVKSEILNFNEKYNRFYYGMNGLSIQSRKNCLLPWKVIDGLESSSQYSCLETDFIDIHEDLKTSEISRIIYDFKLFRTRIMSLNPKKCYSIHKDSTWRLHIPIVTNDQCFFYFPDYKEQFFLEEGHVYLVNTVETHTFINAGNIERIHFIGCIDNIVM